MHHLVVRVTLLSVEIDFVAQNLHVVLLEVFVLRFQIAHTFVRHDLLIWVVVNKPVDNAIFHFFIGSRLRPLARQSSRNFDIVVAKF